MTSVPTSLPASVAPASPHSTTWTDPNQLAGAPASANEFSADVALAIRDLRTRHGLDTPVALAEAAKADAAQPGLLDALRAELHDILPGVNRRGFLRLTGAAAVFSLAACGKKPDVIVPQAVATDGAVVGKPRHYSTVIRDSGRPVPCVVKTYDGRPIKIEGNPDHAPTKGRADAATQAALLNLYDPDRGHAVLGDGPLQRVGSEWKKSTWSELDAAAGKTLASGQIGLITGPCDGPSRQVLLHELRHAFAGRLRHAELDPRQDPAEREMAQRLSGVTGPLTYRINTAAVVVTIGSDLLADEDLACHVGFGDFRRNQGTLIAVESALSQTGIAADVRVRASLDQHGIVAWAIAAEVAKALGVSLPAAVAAVVKPDLGPTIDGSDALGWIAAQLVAAHHAGKPTLVYASGYARGGDITGRMEAAAWLNASLGNHGRTIMTPAKAAWVPSADAGVVVAAPEAVLSAAAAGELSTLILWNANPAYHLGATKLLATAASKCTIIALGDRVDESADLAHWFAPTLHDLESWGDADLGDGLAIQQPCVQPLWNSRAGEESLMAFTVAASAGGSAPGTFIQPKAKPAAGVALALSVVSRQQLWVAAEHGIATWGERVRAIWAGEVRAFVGALSAPKDFVNAALAAGVVQQPITATIRAAINTAAITPLRAHIGTGLRLSIRPSRTIADGTWANNAWLQEIPDPVSKLTWDNWLAVSPADAPSLDVKQDDVVTVTVGAVSLELPVHIQDGQHPGTLETFLGYGRTHAGRVADLTREDGYSCDVRSLIPLLDAPVTITKTGKTYVLACMQGHHRMEGRDIARSDVAELNAQDPDFAKRRPATHWETGNDGKKGGRLSAWGTTHPAAGHKWGMVVDIDACTGCNACIVACSAENNVPVVGRDEVRRSREMHWMRVDRYFTSANGPDGKPDRLNVTSVQQPVMCQQCDNAPCEAVCPANATMHNDEGINIQVYNRCIGTRYCSNNCPYKVRRFNWYEYSALRAGPQGSGSPAAIQKPFTRTIALATSATATANEVAHAPLQMLLNPEVTVRSKGVMEKCNLCVQRTREIRYAEKDSGRKHPDGAITTACAQTCPTQAITFGDRNDPATQVSQAAAKPQAYLMLDEVLNTRPGVSYLPRLYRRPATAAELATLKPVEGGPAHDGPKQGAH